MSGRMFARPPGGLCREGFGSWFFVNPKGKSVIGDIWNDVTQGDKGTGNRKIAMKCPGKFDCGRMARVSFSLEIRRKTGLGLIDGHHIEAPVKADPAAASGHVPPSRHAMIYRDNPPRPIDGGREMSHETVEKTA